MFKRVLLILLAALAAWLVFELITFPDVTKLKNAPPKTTAFMEQRRKQLRAAGKNDELKWRWVPYGRISPYLRRGVLVAEDSSFYEHEGIDTKGLKEAWERNLERRKLTHGGSTITQQLAKNLYLSPSRNPVRKVREYFIARSLEKHLTKKRILEIYLNVVEMGERVYGAEAAARHYFGKSASALTAREAALLAGCLPNPRVMNPGSPNRRLRSRQRMILSRMRRWGYTLERDVLTEKKPEPEKTETTETTATETAADTAPVTETDTSSSGSSVPRSSSEELPPEEPRNPEEPEEPPATVTETSEPPPTNT